MSVKEHERSLPRHGGILCLGTLVKSDLGIVVNKNRRAVPAGVGVDYVG